jgi:hypothetical protein
MKHSSVRHRVRRFSPRHLCFVAVSSFLLPGCILIAAVLPSELFVEAHPTRAELAPGVRAGEELLECASFARCDALGEVTDIAFGRVDGDYSIQLILCGTRGFALLDSDSGRVVRITPFERPTGTERVTYADYAVHDVDGDGDLEFVRIPGWRTPVALNGGDGKLRWMDIVLARTVGVEDLDGNGALEFIIDSEASPGARRLDHLGQLVRIDPWNLWWPEFFDVNGDGSKDILYASGDAVWARDAAGELLAQTKLPRNGTVNRVFVISAWDHPSKKRLVAGEYVGDVQYDYSLSSDAKTVGPLIDFEAICPLIEAKPARFAGTPVAWSELSTLEKPAAIAGVKATRLRLRLFDQAGTTLYDEIIQPPDREKLRTAGASYFRGGEAGVRPDQLFVAYGPMVWVYRARHRAESPKR